MEAGLAELLLEHGPDPLLLLTPDGSVSYVNTAAEHLFGYSRSQLLGTDSGLLLAETFRAGYRTLLAGLAGPSARPANAFTGSGRRADGTEIPVEITCSLLPAGDAGPGAPSVALSVRAAGQRSRPHRNPAAFGGPAAGGTTTGVTTGGAAPRDRDVPPSAAPPAAFAGHDDEVRAGALRDPLTALPNTVLFTERLAAALRRPDPVDVVLLTVDLRNPGGMPGRSVTDQLLVQVASRLRNCVRTHDTVARLGANEFVVLLTECLNAEPVARRIAASLRRPLRAGGTLLRPAVGMGLATRTPQTLDGAELLRQAAADRAATGGRATAM
ncbi:diguanylate cyclase domain-containing protein [Pseudarthrobacter sp. 1C304]|uniref:diguanylate cyclase domain-containing protein n=1 Tax=Pseudarthrobacter sp. 1C304 TaxID=3457438 RepID=UPI003FD3EF5A